MCASRQEQLYAWRSRLCTCRFPTLLSIHAYGVAFPACQSSYACLPAALLQYSVEQELADLPNCNVDQLKKAHVTLPPNVNATSWLDTSKEYISAFIRKCGPNVVGAEEEQAGKATYFTLTGAVCRNLMRLGHPCWSQTPLHHCLVPIHCIPTHSVTEFVTESMCWLPCPWSAIALL
jgi:hypothetical protein